MPTEVKVIAHSVNKGGDELLTFQLKYPRFIHSEVLTHRVFSRNASSSRAIPVMKMIKQVWSDPAMPIHWGANQAGMQAKNELSGFKKAVARGLWRTAAKVACVFAYGMVKVGLHKQVANRILEPWQYIHVVLSGTTFDNFFGLRAHPDAQPEIQDLAVKMRDAKNASAPILRLPFRGVDSWHLPYVTDQERRSLTLENLLKISAARCCRVSYLKHDGHPSTIGEDIDLCDKLINADPIHASPFEHQGEALGGGSGNFDGFGWIQQRLYIESGLKRKKAA